MDSEHVQEQLKQAMSLLDKAGAGESLGDDMRVQMGILLLIHNSLEAIIGELRRPR